MIGTYAPSPRDCNASCAAWSATWAFILMIRELETRRFKLRPASSRSSEDVNPY